MAKPNIVPIPGETHREWVFRGLKALSVRVSAPGDELFTLKSGERSRYYFDVKKTALHREMHRSLAFLLHVASIRLSPKITAMAGVALGGCHLASIVAFDAAMQGKRVDVVHVRQAAKEHGTKSLVEGPGIEEPGEQCVLFEDVVTTGGSSLAAIAELEKVGYAVLGIVAVIDRRVEPTDSVGSYPLVALYTLADFQDENFPT